MSIRDSHLLESFETNKPVHGGIQHVYKFKNGFGASVIKHKYSYGGKKGLWEVALLKGDELFYNADFPDVKGHLNDPQVDAELIHIANYEQQ
tara:strand:- start:377 stop:652 length:276 start_codon:yes stop_codon:yes gene_type:complete